MSWTRYWFVVANLLICDMIFAEFLRCKQSSTQKFTQLKEDYRQQQDHGVDL